MMLSLWLLPPEPLFTQLQNQMHVLSVESRGHCPTFLPHVTVLGGMDCNLDDHDDDDDDDDGNSVCNNANNIVDGVSTKKSKRNKLLQQFRNNLKGFGSVPCHFIPLSQVKDNADRKRNGNAITAYDRSDDDDGEQMMQWNQCSVMIMKRCTEFLDLIRLSYRIFEPFLVTPRNGEEAAEGGFKPPLREPHYSFAYGIDKEIIDDLCRNHIETNVLQDFDSTEAVLMITDPPTLQGARSQWEEIGRIDLG